MTKDLSKQICEKCGIKKHRIEDKSFCWCDDCQYRIDAGAYGGCNRPIGKQCPPHYKYVYPDFGQPENKLRLIDILVDNDHEITLCKDYCSISNCDTDFVNDCYNEHFKMYGGTFLEALYNYLTIWINEYTETEKGLKDTSHTLTREECCYPRGYDDLLKDIERIKQSLREAEWNYE